MATNYIINCIIKTEREIDKMSDKYKLSKKYG